MDTTNNVAHVDVYTPRDENELVVIVVEVDSADLSFEIRAPYLAVSEYVVVNSEGTAVDGALAGFGLADRTITIEFSEAAAGELGLPQSMTLDVDGTEEEIASAGTWITEMLAELEARTA